MNVLVYLACDCDAVGQELRCPDTVVLFQRTKVAEQCAPTVSKQLLCCSLLCGDVGKWRFLKWSVLCCNRIATRHCRASKSLSHHKGHCAPAMEVTWPLLEVT